MTNKINRKYKLNENFFDNINSEIKAYWLGFIWADGCIFKTNPRSSGPNRLNLTQKISELNHLELFKHAIQSNHKITLNNNKQTYSLNINSRKLCKSLENLGFNIKTKRINISKMPNKLIRHFIRGYFDGDGCISIYTQNFKNYKIHRQEFSLTGNKDLLLQIQKILENNINITRNLKIKTYKNTNKAVTIRYGKQSDIDKLFKYLYENASIYLKSKYNKFLTFYSYYNKQ